MRKHKPNQPSFLKLFWLWCSITAVVTLAKIGCEKMFDPHQCQGTMNSKHAVSTHLTWGHGAPPMPHRDYGRSNHSTSSEGNGICDICSARRGHRYSNSSCNCQYLEEMRVSLYEVGHLWDTHCRPWLSNEKESVLPM